MFLLSCVVACNCIVQHIGVLVTGPTYREFDIYMDNNGFKKNPGLTATRTPTLHKHLMYVIKLKYCTRTVILALRTHNTVVDVM